MLVDGGLIAILVLYARQLLGLGSLGFGLLVACFALGGVAGAMAAPALTARFGAARILKLTVVGSALAVAAAGGAGSGVTAGLFVAGYGAVNLAWTVTAVSLRQSLVPPELLGRVAMAYQMVTGGGTALGAAAAGFTARTFGLRAPFYAGGLVLAAAALISTRPTGRAAPVAGSATRSTGPSQGPASAPAGDTEAR